MFESIKRRKNKSHFFVYVVVYIWRAKRFEEISNGLEKERQLPNQGQRVVLVGRFKVREELDIWKIGDRRGFPGPVVEDPQCVRVAIDIQLNDVVDLKPTNAVGPLPILTLHTITTIPTIGSLVVA